MDTLIEAGAAAPPISDVDLTGPPRLLWFYKVTCPVCEMAAPAMQRFESAYPGTVTGVGQDPPRALESFGREFAITFPVVVDDPPYPASDAYGIQTVPTMVLVDAGTIVDVAVSWDRDAVNRLSAAVAGLTGRENVPISTEGDGLPSFRPG